MKLNPYNIKWAVIVGPNGKAIFEHAANKESLLEKIKPAHGSSVYIITDKQFGMIQNSYNGKTPNIENPLTHQLVVNQNHGIISVIPMTEKQFLNPIQY